MRVCRSASSTLTGWRWSIDMVACATARSAVCLVAVLLIASLCGRTPARAADALSATEASKEIENPLTRQITLPFRYEAQFNEDAGRSTKHMVELNQAVVRFRDPRGEDDDAHNRAVLATVQHEGTCYPSGTVWRGVAAIRLSVTSYRTGP